MAIDKQIMVLKEFNANAEKLWNLSFTRSLLKDGVGISYVHEKEELIAKRKGPGSESIDAFVLTYRFFIQNNEKASFGNLYILYSGLEDFYKEKNQFIGARARLNSYLDLITRFYYGNHYSKRNIHDIFIYGGLSHHNKKKKQIYDDWMSDKSHAQSFIFDFVLILVEVMKFIKYVKGLNGSVIKSLEKVS